MSVTDLKPFLKTVGIYLAVVLVIGVMLFPIYSVFLTSVQYEVDIRSPQRFSLIPSYITLDHYRTVMEPGHIVPIREAMINSFIVCLSAAFLSLAIASMAAYAFARLKFRGKNLILFGLSSIYLFPAILFVIPLFVLVVNLGLVDTYISLIIPYTAFILPFLVWVIKNFFEQIPQDLEAAAMVDGCTIPQVIYRIVLPLAVPGLVAGFLFGFILSWIEFLTPLVFTSNLNILTVALGLYRGTAEIKMGQQAAAAFITMIPVLVLTLLFERFIRKGLLAGAEK